MVNLEVENYCLGYEFSQTIFQKQEMQRKLVLKTNFEICESLFPEKKAVAILLLLAFYPWRLFCRNHSRVFILPYLLHFSR